MSGNTRYTNSTTAITNNKNEVRERKSERQTEKGEREILHTKNDQKVSRNKTAKVNQLTVFNSSY